MKSKSVFHLFQAQVAKNGDRPFLRRKVNGVWEEITWSQMDEKVRACALAIARLGVEKGKAIGILSESRVEWVFADLAIAGCGCVTTAAYPSSPAKDAAYILSHAEVQLVFVEDKKQLDKVVETLPQFPVLKKIVVFDMTGVKEDVIVTGFETFLETGRTAGEEVEKDLSARIASLNPETMLTYIYTSGTTGPPKGAMLTHGSAVFVAETCADMNLVNSSDHSLSFLPLAHALERVVFYMSIKVGGLVSFAESLYKVAENLPEVRPTVLVGVPRVYEKIYEKVLASVEAGSPTKKKIFKWALETGKEFATLNAEGKSIPAALKLKHAVADALVFKKIRAVAGGRIRWLGSGGAPLTEEVNLFFNAIGMPMIQAYGLTETTAPAIVTPVSGGRVGKVGKRMPGVDCEIAADGEIIIRGPNVFKGYFKNPEATAEAFDGDWFKSGDLGEFDEEGYLSITGRKKDLIITAGGKNITPQKLESMYASIPLVSQVVIAGDGKKYLSAIFTLNREELEAFALEKGISTTDGQPLDHHPDVLARIEKDVREVNRNLPGYEAIKKFKVVPHEFTVDTGELTPTMKVKKKVVLERYKNLVDEMYS